MLEQEAAGDRAKRHAEAGDPGPHADRRCSLLGVGEGVGEDGQSGREDQGRGQAHQAAGHDQHVRAARKPGESREPGEAHQPDLQGALASVPVAQAPPHQQQRREDEGVSVDDPLQVAGRRVELLADRGEGDVDDRVVDEREKNAQAQDGEYRPPPGMDPVGAGRRCPSPQPGPRPAASARNDPRGRRAQAGHHAGPSTSPKPDNGRIGDSEDCAKRSVLPSWLSRFAGCHGRHRRPEQRCRCRRQSVGRPIAWQVSKNLPVLKIDDTLG